MSLLGRLARAVRAQITSWVQESEDPEKILDQAVADMQADLIQLRQSVAQAIATQKRTERQCEQTTTIAKEWYNRAQLALQKGEEQQAREALEQRQSRLNLCSQLMSHIDEQKAIVNQLKTNMRQLETKIADARTRRDMYIARARSAEASQRIQEMIGQVGSRSQTSMIERMEDKVMALEAQAEAMAELNDALLDPLESRFAALEQGGANSVETELAAMKAQLPNRSQNPKDS
ncbi:MAG: PspA/IM30 family protein [Cyanobacteria bacterium J06626_18]